MKNVINRPPIKNGVDIVRASNCNIHSPPSKYFSNDRNRYYDNNKTSEGNRHKRDSVA